MLRSVESLLEYTILATDGEIGRVHDFYFDDDTWQIRYLVVDPGYWLPDRKVLVSPNAIDKPDWEAHLLPVTLTKKQIGKSPDINTEKPVSHQQETELREYYGWPPVNRLGGGLLGGPMMSVPSMAGVEALKADREPEQEGVPQVQAGDPHLRSVKEVTGYYIQARDGDIGHVEDFVVEDATWTIHYMVVDTRNWLPGKMVLVSPSWIERVSWEEAGVHVDLSQETIKNSPEYDSSIPLERSYETKLHDHYDRPKYWD